MADVPHNLGLVINILKKSPHFLCIGQIPRTVMSAGQSSLQFLQSTLLSNFRQEKY